MARQVTKLQLRPEPRLSVACTIPDSLPAPALCGERRLDVALDGAGPACYLIRFIPAVPSAFAVGARTLTCASPLFFPAGAARSNYAVRPTCPRSSRPSPIACGQGRLPIISAPALWALCRWRHYGHAWQHEHGTPSKPPHHNKEFRARCEAFGLPSDEGGHDLGVRHGSPFEDYCRRHGVAFPPPPGVGDSTGGGPSGPDPSPLLPVPPVKPRGSKMRKWSCPCGVNARVAIADFQAVCCKCGGRFRLAG